jgi:hypothetical protein
MDHIIALSTPITSSGGGAGPLGDQILLRTYRGEVATDEWMTPAKEISDRQKKNERDAKTLAQGRERQREKTKATSGVGSPGLDHPLLEGISSDTGIHTSVCEGKQKTRRKWIGRIPLLQNVYLGPRGSLPTHRKNAVNVGCPKKSMTNGEFLSTAMRLIFRYSTLRVK